MLAVDCTASTDLQVCRWLHNLIKAVRVHGTSIMQQSALTERG